ncbi:MAG TPA: hypothetical protein VMY39_05365, partial [Planctomycetota bacterium]|nr:hypothetical protein [Planctomycetota bacterium]
VGEVASDTNALVARISRKDTGLVTQKMQDTVVRTLKDLIDALQRERRQRQQQQQQGGGGGGGGGAQRIVPPLAELKMIRTMHKRVSDETGDFDDALRKGEVRQDDVKPRVNELADKEKNIGKLLKDLMDALSEQQQ